MDHKIWSMTDVRTFSLLLLPAVILLATSPAINPTKTPMETIRAFCPFILNCN